MKNNEVGSWEMQLLLKMINDMSHIGLELDWVDKLAEGFRCWTPAEFSVCFDELTALSEAVETTNINIVNNGNGETWMYVSGVDLEELYEKAKKHDEQKNKGKAA